MCLGLQQLSRTALVAVALTVVASLATLSGGQASAGIRASALREALGPAADAQAVDQQGPEVRLEPQVNPVLLGTELDVYVFMAGAEDLAAFQVTIEYDDSYLELVSVDMGPFLGSSGREVYIVPPIIAPGSITYSALALPEEGKPGASGDGDLAIVRFRTLAEGDAAIELKEVLIESSTGERTELEGRGVVLTITAEPTPAPTEGTPTTPPPTEPPHDEYQWLYLPLCQA
jgi:hypothetical protein